MLLVGFRRPVATGLFHYIFILNRTQLSGARLVEHGTNFSCKVVAPEWLVQKIDTLIQTSLVDDGIFGIARRVENRDPRSATRYLSRQFRPPHAAGKHNIGKQQIDLRRCFEDQQRGGTVGRLQDPVSEIGKQRDA